jgi:hypothetical protein
MPTVKQQPHDPDRLPAYSGAVFAVIVTIMARQLGAPDSPRLTALTKLWQPALFERRVLREATRSPTSSGEWLTPARWCHLRCSHRPALSGFVPWAELGLICPALVLHLKPDIGVPRRRWHYCERCRKDRCAARARQSRPADRADGPAMRISRRVDPAHLTVRSVLNSYTCCRSPRRSGRPALSGPQPGPGREGR